MITTPSIAILLSAYNGVEWIEEQVYTIINQKHVNIELFISVDLSTDDTYDLCKKLEQENTNIFVLEYGDRFGGAAKNFFRLIRDVDFVGFDYVALADQDDIWNDSKLDHAVNMIEKNNLDGYSSDVLAFWKNGRKKLIKKSFPQKKFDYFFEGAGPGCTYVMKKNSVQKFKKFLIENWINVNLVQLHDWMIYAYFRSQYMKWKIDDKPLMSYRQHRHNQVGLNLGLKAYAIRFNKIRNKWYRNEVLKIINLLSLYTAKDVSLNRFFLIKNFWNLRRRPRDLFILLSMNIFRVF